MLNMANDSFREGKLPESLRTGLIKLIPKGKNSTRVEDWRPITLLPTSYKIISGVIAGRLEKTLPHIIGRSQKGFLKHKNMGTVLHNVIDGIANSWEEKEQMGVLLVDFIKAFDSVEHSFIKKAMEYFNIGPVLVGMVMTLLNERKACINLVDRYSGSFKIERGTPQGDRSSPYIFIICVEILLIRLEMGGDGILVGRNCMDGSGGVINSIGEAFADDLTAIYKLGINATRKILEILDDFSRTSGLCVNKDKTHIMVTGTEWEGGTHIEGIEIKRECKLLGAIIDNKVKSLQQNWDKVIVKIRGLINYWNQFNLTLTGRIMVGKTFLLSQATFMMGIIPLEKRTAERIEQLIEKYVLGKLQVARDRIYNRPEQGGLGLLKIWELNTAMKSSWVNRWKREGRSVDITGHLVLTTSRNMKIETIDHSRIDCKRAPTAHCIAVAWAEFRNKVYENDGNIYAAQIFENPGIKSRIGRMIGEGNILSRARYNTFRNQMLSIKLGDITTEHGIIEKREMAEKLGFEITEVEYGKIRDNVSHIRGKFKPVWEMKEKAKTISEWLRPIKKGSNKIRALMSGRGSRTYRNFKFENIRPVSTLWEQMGIEKDDILIACGMTLWGIKEVDADFRQFMFRWNQGMIHGNTVISHFGDNIDRKCTFCKITEKIRLGLELGREPTIDELNAIAIPDENRPHIMWDCNTVNTCIMEVYNRVWNKDGQVDKKAFLMGKAIGFLETSQLYMTVNMFIKYRIWKYKLAETLPKTQAIVNDVNVFLEQLSRYNKWRILIPLLRQLVQM
jgi:hypothetical protein